MGRLTGRGASGLALAWGFSRRLHRSPVSNPGGQQGMNSTTYVMRFRSATEPQAVPHMNLETLPGMEIEAPAVPAILRGADLTRGLVSEQPQARLEAFGRAALSDGELLALVLQGAGVPVNDAKARALESLAAAGGLAKMADWDAAQWRLLVGMTALKADY